MQNLFRIRNHRHFYLRRVKATGAPSLFRCPGLICFGSLTGALLRSLCPATCGSCSPARSHRLSTHHRLAGLPGIHLRLLTRICGGLCSVGAARIRRLQEGLNCRLSHRHLYHHGFWKVLTQLLAL